MSMQYTFDGNFWAGGVIRDDYSLIQDQDGTWYRYIGNLPKPFNVTAGTKPNSKNWVKITVSNEPNFTKGATIESKKDFILDETTGIWYYWNGKLPKTIPPGGTIITTGGLGKTAWMPLEGMLSQSIPVMKEIKEKFDQQEKTIQEIVVSKDKQTSDESSNKESLNLEIEKIREDILEQEDRCEHSSKQIDLMKQNTESVQQQLKDLLLQFESFRESSGTRDSEVLLQFQQLQEALQNLSQSFSEQTSSLQTQIQRIEENSLAIQNQGMKIDSITQSIQEQIKRIDNNSTSISSLQDKITSLETVNSSQQKEIESLKTSQRTMEDRITSVEQINTNQQKDIEALKTSNQDLNLKVSTNADTIATQKTTINSMSQSLADYGNRLSKAEASLLKLGGIKIL